MTKIAGSGSVSQCYESGFVPKSHGSTTLAYSSVEIAIWNLKTCWGIQALAIITDQYGIRPILKKLTYVTRNCLILF
jgi:hypothetical protein